MSKPPGRRRLPANIEVTLHAPPELRQACADLKLLARSMERIADRFDQDAKEFREMVQSHGLKPAPADRQGLPPGCLCVPGCSANGICPVHCDESPLGRPK